jgi:hypothetical protein
MPQTQINPITNKPYARHYKPGQESGAITLEWRSANILEASVRSFTKPKGPRHKIEVNARTGQVRCSCIACQRAIARNGYPTLTQSSGYCKHIQAWWKELAEAVIEHNNEIASRATSKVSTERPYTDVTSEFLGGADWSPTTTIPAHEIKQAEHLRARHAEGRLAVIRGSVYVIGPEDAPDSERGKAGQRFVIRFNDGRTVDTCNLWESWIPAHAWREFPENARFLSKAEVDALCG